MKPRTAYPPRRILVVDDNQDSATSLAMLLRVTGHEAHTAFDGPEAIEKAAIHHPEVALLDLGMPRMNGYEACRRIRAQEKSRDMLILALTGLGGDECADACHEAGFDAYLQKPVNLDALMSKLAALSSMAIR